MKNGYFAFPGSILHLLQHNGVDHRLPTLRIFIEIVGLEGNSSGAVEQVVPVLQLKFHGGLEEENLNLIQLEDHYDFKLGDIEALVADVRGWI